MKKPRPAYTYRGHRRMRHFRDGAPFIRLSGSNWRRQFAVQEKSHKWPRRMMGFVWKLGSRSFWDKIKPMIDYKKRAFKNQT